MEYYFQRYGDLELHRRMIGDRPRTEAFAKAISEVVGPSHIVLDVGTGTGILAMLAAKAGAKRVYGVDQAEITQTAANLAKANGLAKKVRIFRGPAADLILPEKVDVIVSEWLGNLALVEGMLDDLIAARDSNLKTNGKMIPSKVTILLAPIDDTVLYCREGPGFWRDPILGLNFSPLEDLELGQGRGQQLRVEPSAMLAPGTKILELDMAKVKVKDPFQKGSFEVIAKRDGVMNGFVGWFCAQLSPNVALDTGPMNPETHWSQTYFPFPGRLVKKGSKTKVHYAISRDSDERRHLRMKIKVGQVTQHYLLE